MAKKVNDIVLVRKVASGEPSQFGGASENTAGANVPRGTTAQRVTPGATESPFRYNTTTGALEYWSGTKWFILGGSDQAIFAADSDFITTGATYSTVTNFGSTWTHNAGLVSINTGTGIITLAVGYVYKVEVSFNYRQTGGNNRDSVFLQVQDNIDSGGYALASGGQGHGYTRFIGDGGGSISVISVIDALAATTCLARIQTHMLTALRSVTTEADEAAVSIRVIE